MSNKKVINFVKKHKIPILIVMGIISAGAAACLRLKIKESNQISDILKTPWEEDLIGRLNEVSLTAINEQEILSADKNITIGRLVVTLEQMVMANILTDDMIIDSEMTQIWLK